MQALRGYAKFEFAKEMPKREFAINEILKYTSYSILVYG